MVNIKTIMALKTALIKQIATINNIVTIKQISIMKQEEIVLIITNMIETMVTACVILANFA